LSLARIASSSTDDTLALPALALAPLCEAVLVIIDLELPNEGDLVIVPVGALEGVVDPE
jgi:hypothetical protein